MKVIFVKDVRRKNPSQKDLDIATLLIVDDWKGISLPVVGMTLVLPTWWFEEGQGQMGKLSGTWLVTEVLSTIDGLNGTNNEATSSKKQANVFSGVAFLPAAFIHTVHVYLKLKKEAA